MHEMVKSKASSDSTMRMVELVESCWVSTDTVSPQFEMVDQDWHYVKVLQKSSDLKHIITYYNYHLVI
jgi:hypothetical protein